MNFDISRSVLKEMRSSMPVLFQSDNSVTVTKDSIEVFAHIMSRSTCEYEKAGAKIKYTILISQNGKVYNTDVKVMAVGFRDGNEKVLEHVAFATTSYLDGASNLSQESRYIQQAVDYITEKYLDGEQSKKPDAYELANSDISIIHDMFTILLGHELRGVKEKVTLECIEEHSYEHLVGISTFKVTVGEEIEKFLWVNQQGQFPHSFGYFLHDDSKYAATFEGIAKAFENSRLSKYISPKGYING